MTEVPANGMEAADGLDRANVTSAASIEPNVTFAAADPLLDELASLFERIDPVPDHVIAAADAAMEVVAAWRDLDTVDYGRLLGVVSDTAIEPQAAAVRAGGGPRLVTFGTDAGERCIEVEVGVEPAGTLRLVGLVVPTGPGELEVRSSGDAFRVPVDEIGRFRAVGVPAGPLSFVLHYPGQQAVPTDWITV
jgi:hypothetical protein